MKYTVSGSLPIISEKEINGTIERKFKVLGVIATENNIADRIELEKKVAAGSITPKAFLEGLKSTWRNMNAREKELELARVVC